MADIQIGRFGQLLQGLFNLKQRHVLGNVLPDVMPVLDVENRRPENEALAGSDLCAAFTPVAAVAGNLGNATLTLPASSGRIAVIERIIVRAGSALQYRLQIGSGTPVGATGAFSQFMDTRRRLTRATCVIRTSSSAASLTTNGFCSFGVGNQTLSAWEGAVVLANNPQLVGNGPVFVMVEAQTANTAFDVSFQWRERDLGQQENFLG